MAQITQTVAQGILDGQGYTDNEVRQLAHFWLSARAPADSVTAQSSGLVVGYRVSDPHEPDLGHWLSEEPGAAWCVSEPLALATPPAQAADSVLEDAALLQEARTALWQPANVDLCERIDAYLDAARKQGANHDNA